MFRIICPSCGSKLNAKKKLIGKNRPCPKCGQPIFITSPDGSAPTPSSMVDEPDSAQLGFEGNKKLLPSRNLLTRLDRNNRYWICDHAHVVATWTSDGKGWLLKTNSGMVNAARNRDQIPTRGNFVLVELNMETGDEGLRLQGISVYALPPQWSLPAIAEGDDRICEKVFAYASLTREQKAVIRLALKANFMHEIYGGAKKVMEYLSNTDAHTHVVSEKA